MEDKPRQPRRRTNEEEEVDLGTILYKTGGYLTAFMLAIGKLLASVAEIILLAVFFIRRNILWLVAGAVIGLGYGFYLSGKNGDNYHSTAIVRTNFNSARPLYESIGYFNSLIGSGQTKELAEIFNIPEQQAAALLEFSVEPEKSELILAEMYNRRIASIGERSTTLDTFWLRTLNYKDYKAGLTIYDYPEYRLQVIASHPTLFPAIQEGLIRYHQQNPELKQAQLVANEINQQEIRLLQASLQGLDSLRMAYISRLESGAATGEPINKTILLNGQVMMMSPELELFNKMLQLKDELRAVTLRASRESQPVQVITPFGSIGKQDNFVREKMLQYGLYGLLIALGVLLLIGLYRMLLHLERLKLQDRPSSIRK